MGESYGPWQRPDYKGDDIYPGFGCWDKMRAGGVNIGGTRLLAHDILWSVITGGWDQAVSEFTPAVGADHYRRFLHDLLGVRGEFGRLLLTLAAAEKAEQERHDAVLDDATGGRGGLVNVTPGDPDAVQLPPAWWETPDLRQLVIDQLRRCLDVLTEENDRAR